MNLLFVDSFKGEKYIGNLGLGYIAALLREKIPDVNIKIINTNYNIESSIKDFNPDIIGISSISECYKLAMNVARVCKSHGLPVIIGGSHISSLPETLSPDMDVGVIGEGEITFLEFLMVFREYGISKDKFRNVKGIVFRETNNAIHRTPPREPISDINELPFPARDLMNIKKGGIISLLSSRGCPYNCIFCASTRTWAKNLRFSSPKHVVDECEAVIKKYKPTAIWFVDDLGRLNLD